VIAVPADNSDSDCILNEEIEARSRAIWGVPASRHGRRGCEEVVHNEKPPFGGFSSACF